MKTEPQLQPAAWYREPMVWLLIAIPAFALVGGIVILSYALLHPDAEVHNERRPAPTVTGVVNERFDRRLPA